MEFRQNLVWKRQSVLIRSIVFVIGEGQNLHVIELIRIRIIPVEMAVSFLIETLVVAFTVQGEAQFVAAQWAGVRVQFTLNCFQKTLKCTQRLKELSSPVTFSRFSPAPVKTDRAVRVQ